MNRNFLIAVGIAAFCAFTGCSHKHEVPTLRLRSGLGRPVYVTKAGAPVIDIIDSLPLHGVLLSSPRVFDYSRDYIGVSTDDRRLYFFDARTGALVSDLTHVGRGPQEYVYPYSVSRRDSLVYVSDTPQIHKLLTYSIDGRFVGTLALPGPCVYRPLWDGYHVLAMSNQEKLSFSLYRGEEPVRQEKYCSGPEETGNVYYPLVRRMNGEFFFHEALGDTLYRMTPDRDIPYLVLDPGDLRMPDRYLAKPADDGGGDAFISMPNPVLAGDFCIVDFGYHGMSCFQIWDVPAERLLYSVIPDPEDPATWGLPYTFRGEQRYFGLMERYDVDGEDILLIVDEDDPCLLRLRLRMPD